MKTESIFVNVQNVVKTYVTGKSQICALDDISFSVNKEEFVAIVGPSGCGKTTVLRVILGLIPKTNGTVIIDGKEVVDPQPSVGMVFQSPALLPWRRVIDNIMLPIEVLRLNVDDYVEKAQDLIKLVGLAGFENKYPWELSGGMRQRVSICRALIHDPGLLLMDEPFGALDAFTREKMNVELLRIWRETKKTIIFVTHNIMESAFLADRVVVMTPRPGRVAKIVKININRPRELAIQNTDEFGAYVTTIRDCIDESVKCQPFS